MSETWVWFLNWEDHLERKSLPTPIFWPGEFHGLYSPWGRKESDTTEWLSLSYIIYLHTHTYTYRERESYIQLNAEFQRIASRDKKAFFNEQCIKIEENNRRGNSRHLFRKIGNIKGTFCPKMGAIRDRNIGDLVDRKDIKKRWKEYMEESYKKRS